MMSHFQKQACMLWSFHIRARSLPSSRRLKGTSRRSGFRPLLSVLSQESSHYPHEYSPDGRLMPRRQGTHLSKRLSWIYETLMASLLVSLSLLSCSCITQLSIPWHLHLLILPILPSPLFCATALIKLSPIRTLFFFYTFFYWTAWILCIRIVIIKTLHRFIAQAYWLYPSPGMSPDESITQPHRLNPVHPLYQSIIVHSILPDSPNKYLTSHLWSRLCISYKPLCDAWSPYQPSRFFLQSLWPPVILSSISFLNICRNSVYVN